MTKKPGRRRRGKKDVILDLSKKAKSSKTSAILKPESKTSNSKKLKGKMSLVTASKDYEGSLALPDKIAQREFETTGQFFRRLDRLVAKAKVEANLEARFDMTLPKDSTDASQKVQRNAKEDSVEPKLSSIQRNKLRRKRRK